MSWDELQYSSQPSATIVKSVKCRSRAQGSIHTLLKSTGTKVQAKVWFGANDLAPLHKLIRAERVGFKTQPGKLRPVTQTIRAAPMYTADEK